MWGKFKKIEILKFQEGMVKNNLRILIRKMADEIRKTALVVDDDIKTAEAYVRYGARHGYDIIIETTLTEALQHSGTRFDLLVIDGLEGKCWDVIPVITADRKVLLSGDESQLDNPKVAELQIEAFEKMALESPLPKIFI